MIEENAANSATLLQRTYLTENIATQSSPLVLHGDNGSPLKAVTVLGLIHQLEITVSHSRPRVSNDKAFSESLFRTTKYHPSYPPNGFASLSQGRAWAQSFVTYYKTGHNHRSLNFVTPDQKHYGQDSQLLQKRGNLLKAKRKETPARWINGAIRNCQPFGQVNLYLINNRTLGKHQKTPPKNGQLP